MSELYLPVRGSPAIVLVSDSSGEVSEHKYEVLILGMQSSNKRIDQIEHTAISHSTA
jgi:hypothetical protein